MLATHPNLSVCDPYLLNGHSKVSCSTFSAELSGVEFENRTVSRGLGAARLSVA